MSDFELGARLRAVRQMQGLSQRELAKRAGVSNAIISLIEQNRTSPSVGLLKKVLAGVPMSLADFFIGATTATWPAAPFRFCTSAMRPGLTPGRPCCDTTRRRAPSSSGAGWR